MYMYIQCRIKGALCPGAHMGQFFFTVVINKKWKCNKPADIILSYVSFLWSQQHFNSAILSNIQYTLIHTNTCTLSVKSQVKN